MSMSLNNQRIWITRPRHQSQQLAELIREYKGQAILIPMLEIKACADKYKIKKAIDTLDADDYIIFVSQNAVEVFFQTLGEEITQTKLFAIGPTTAKCLMHYSNVTIHHPGEIADSENLLDLNEFEQDNVKDKRILIVRGVGGREWLAEKLKEREAIVDYVEVYQRQLPEYDNNFINELWQNEAAAAIVVTSTETLDNLIHVTPEYYRQRLFQIPLVLMSDRIVAYAKEKGFRSVMTSAIKKNDQGLLEALIRNVGVN